MYVYLQKIKFLLIPLLLASIAWGAVQLNSVVYDLEVGIDETYSIVDFNPEGGKTYYNPMIFTTSVGGQYTFENYSSDLTGGTQDTALLIYDDLEADFVIDRPAIFNDGPNIGFGGGQLDTFQGFERYNEPFNGTITLAEDTTYAAVFSSFSPDALGTMQVRLTAPGQIYSVDLVPIPELKDTGLWIALIIGFFVAFSYMKIKSGI
ncbi:MAG: hypothetical protein CMH18_11450 [Methylophaga sp.]|uniref:hypothetical protein n=1 Tax=Methylophaga sp. TaxID=2024840 RepID=UPI000C906B2D|nr:hypothetical protein [Methylophaga sp.]MAL50365.1 hypothetical protein [Methylophaga sp.]|tara:strand:- start:126 stop:743 length:618 start_codon:yes stop_codon:yes gene_type:complete